MHVVRDGAWLKDDRFERIGRREANHKEREKRQKNRPLRCNKKIIKERRCLNKNNSPV